MLAPVRAAEAPALTVEEARNAALLIQRCLKLVKDMELAARESNAQQVEALLHANDLKFFDQATNLLLQSTMLDAADKADMQNIKRYVFSTLRKMKDIVKERHSIPKRVLLSSQELPSPISVHPQRS